jgi:hypothetical protein
MTSVGAALASSPITLCFAAFLAHKLWDSDLRYDVLICLGFGLNTVKTQTKLQLATQLDKVLYN